MSSTIIHINSRGEARISTEYLAGQDARIKVNKAVRVAADTVTSKASDAAGFAAEKASQVAGAAKVQATRVYDFARGFIS